MATARTPKEPRDTKNLIFKTNFDGKPDEKINVIAYAFDAQGNLLDSAPLKDGQAALALDEEQAKHARIFFAPEVPQERGGEKTTLEMMTRLKAYEATWTFDPKQRVYELLEIPDYLWKWWPWCKCRVRGRVVRPVTIGGVTYDKPVCHARVHICEVDRWPWIIPQLPDKIIFRLRDELLKLIEWPPRPIPIPDPPPFEFDPGVIDPSPLAIAQMNRRAFDPQPEPPGVGPVMKKAQLAMGDEVALNPQPLPPRETMLEMRTGAAEVMLNPQPLPPKAALMDVSMATRAALTSASKTIVQQALIDNLQLIRPYLCIWDWLHPYFCTCDEIKTVITDMNGRFDTNIWYQCLGDHPDLYFWVEYFIGGVWTTVYHPSVCCNTYWNYVCGSEVTIRVTDPRVPWCDDDPHLPGKQVAILSLGHNVGITEIQRQSAGANEGLTTDGQPFGGSVEPHVWFGDGLLASGITHYRWSYRHLNNPPSGVWHAMDQQVIRHYGEIMADSTLAFKAFELGPDPAFAGQNVFKIRPQNPPLNVGAVSSSWAPEVNARLNTASAFFRTDLLVGGNAILGAGKYELKLELIRIVAGVPQVVNLTDEGVLLKIPTIDAPYPPSTVPTRAVPTDAAFPMDNMEERVIRDGANKIVAFRLVIHVDNNPCDAAIYDVWADNPANEAGPCGFIQYANKLTSLAHLSFKAYHRNQFATFSFWVNKGSTGTVAVASASGRVGMPHNGFANNAATGHYAKNVGVQALLDANGHICTKAAFSENIYVWAMATDGWSRLSYLDASAPSKAFALEPAS